MKKVIVEFITILSVLVSSFDGNAQTNLVPNGDFESGGNPTCTYISHSQYEIDNWLHCVGTFDWRDWNWINSNNCNPTSAISFPTTTLSNRCAGIYADEGNSGCYDYNAAPENVDINKVVNESITVKLMHPLSSNSTYKLSMDVYLIETTPIPIDDITIHLKFATSDKWYHASGSFSENNNVKKTHSIEVDNSDINTWVHLETYFNVSIENNGVLEYLIIQGDKDNDHAYIYIDNVELLESCESSCILPKLYEPISFTPGFEPTDHSLCAVNNSPYYFLVENATNIWFTVFDSWGGELYSVHQHDPMGLIDAGYNDFMFIWNGYNNNNIVPTGDWLFPYILTVSNCRDTYSIIGEDDQFIVVLPDEYNSPIIVPPVQEYYFPIDCCIPYACFENTNFTGFFREDVYDYIIAGESVCSSESGSVTISSGSEVIFNAENEIILKPGFYVEEGAAFNAKIIPCSVSAPNRNTTYRSEFRNKINSYSLNSSDFLPLFEVYPSIINDNATARFELAKVMTVKIYIRNSFGETVQFLVCDMFDAGEYSIPFTASSLASGIYFCVFETNQNIITKKIIIAH